MTKMTNKQNQTEHKYKGNETDTKSSRDTQGKLHTLEHLIIMKGKDTQT